MDIDILFLALFQTKISYSLLCKLTLSVACLPPLISNKWQGVTRNTFVSLRAFTSGVHEAKSLLSRIYETAESNSIGCWGRWFAAWASTTCSSIGSAWLKPWGLAGLVGTGRHQEDTRDETGKFSSLRSMLSVMSGIGNTHRRTGTTHL